MLLTFDSDHMTEYHMEHFLEMYPNMPQSIFFVTQRYLCLESTHHIICPHPLQPTKAALVTLQQQIKQPKSWVRFHSCWWSHKLLELLSNEGYVFSSNILGNTPHKLFGIWERPYEWMDNLAFPDNNSEIPELHQLMDLIAFHPIHILLNSTSKQQLITYRQTGKLNPSTSKKGTQHVFNKALNFTRAD